MKINLNLIEILGKTTTKIEVKDTFMRLMFNTPKNFMNFIMIYSFFFYEWKLKLDDINQYVNYIRYIIQTLTQINVEKGAQSH